MDTLTDLLKKNLLFKGCSPDDFELISGLFQERKVKPNTTIFSEKMPAEALYIVKSGKVKISVMEGEGDEIGLLELGPNDFFGEIALIQESSRAVTARAEGAVEVIMLTRQGLCRAMRPRSSCRGKDHPCHCKAPGDARQGLQRQAPGNPSFMIVAGIDIGTNTIRLLVADTNETTTADSY